MQRLFHRAGIALAIEEHRAAGTIHFQAMLGSKGFQLRAIQAVQQHAAQYLVPIHAVIQISRHRPEQNPRHIQDLITVGHIIGRAHHHSLQIIQPQIAHRSHPRNAFGKVEMGNFFLTHALFARRVKLLSRRRVDRKRQPHGGKSGFYLRKKAFIDSHECLTFRKKGRLDRAAAKAT